ncbi:MAG: RNA-binding protein [Mailhella sp.]|nr:RNA-binding protein [Mailhella sp.]
MAKSIYVGNLPWSTSEEQLKQLFEQFGSVLSAKLIHDRDTGKPKGFGFVEMEDEEALKAIEALNVSEYGGRTLKVNEATPRKEK